jgi:hypothetical protein
MSTKDTFDKCIFCSGPVSHDGYEWVHVHSRDAQCGFAYSLNRPDTFAAIKPAALDASGNGPGILAPAVALRSHKEWSVPERLPPLLDTAVLAELKEHFGDVAQDFTANYVRLWRHRYDRLALALDQRDQMAAMDAVLSLQASSAMVGGLRLAWLAGQLKYELQSSPHTNDRVLLDRILNCGIETVEGLRPDRLELLWARR